MLVFIGKLSLKTLKCIPMCQGFNYFSGLLHHFVFAIVATSSIRVNTVSVLDPQNRLIGNVITLYFSTAWEVFLVGKGEPGTAGKQYWTIPIMTPHHLWLIIQK